LGWDGCRGEKENGHNGPKRLSCPKSGCYDSVDTKTEHPMRRIIPLQPELRPALPTVLGNVDYQRFEVELKRIDEVIRLGGVEEVFVHLSLARWRAEGGNRVPTAKEQARYQQASAQAFDATSSKRFLGKTIGG